MKTYYCWITALIASYQDAIVGGLAKKGYMVGAAAKAGTIIAPGSNASALIALSVYHKDSKIDASKVHDDILAVLKDAKAYFFAVIVSEAADCSWLGANFEVPTAEKPPAPPKKSTMN